MTSDRASSSDTIWTANDLAGNPHEAADKADRVRRMFDAIAQSYDLNNRLHSFGRDQAWRRAAVRLTHPRASDDVLDVACGTGDLAEAFAAAGARLVVGVDFTSSMLEIARRKASRVHRANGIVRPEYCEGDAMNLAFAHASFDIVSIAFGLRNVTDPERALYEFKRVLRPGGRLVVLEFSRPQHPVIRAFHDLYCRHIMPTTAAFIARDRSGAYRYLPRSVATFQDHRTLPRMLERVGFTRVASQAMTFGVCAATVGFVSD